MKEKILKCDYERKILYGIVLRPEQKIYNWLEGTTVVEQWIVMNKENDKASKIGLPVENGDWVVGIKLGDKSWSEYVEKGKAKGFSIENFNKK